MHILFSTGLDLLHYLQLTPAGQRCTMASASLGLSYGTSHFGSALQVENKRDTDHMACAVHFRIPGLSSDSSQDLSDC